MGIAETQDRLDERRLMVERQLRRRGIADPRVLEAMDRVPRHRFVPPGMQHMAYDDCALPIAGGQTISQPYMVARTCELARIGPDDRVLEVGAGSGYQAAVLGELAAEVVAVELIEELVSAARATLLDVGADNVTVVQGDGSLGHPAHAPYDAIVVAAGAPAVPAALVEQLAEGGRLVIPVGRRESVQTLTVVEKTPRGLAQQGFDGCVFVPLRGAGGWS
ncbi:MAG: protein-L-isoaspartate(D-aspartate) O-methyltransferase [Myxococcales bacterium]|jgi:protein-L-isoaspartate(D-aspartate) O-methyltransferase